MRRARRYGAITPELRERAVRTVEELLVRQPGRSISSACEQVAPSFGCHPNSLRSWVKQMGAAHHAAQDEVHRELAATRGVLAVVHELNATLLAREAMSKE